MSLSTLWALCMFLAFPGWAVAQNPTQNAPPSTFVGSWVGVQTWTSPEAPPSAKAPQQVTLNIDLIDGKLVGAMPFFGGTDEATFTDTKIVGDELEANALIKRAPVAQDGAETRPPQRAWYDDVRITFRLKADKLNLTGTAEVLMGDVKWMTFKYELGKKRARY